MKRLIVGTRGSKLAVTQTEWVIDCLKEQCPGLGVELKIIKTTGDRDQKTDLDKFAGMGVFVKELQLAMLKNEIDCAVHSLKDVPEDEPEGLSLVSFPEREDARDVFISGGTKFQDLPPGAKVGSGSPRRIMQLQDFRQDLEFVSIRGNLDTRIRKVKEGELDGIVVAAAGVKRLKRQSEITEYFSFDRIIPAIGQGALAIECRKGDRESIRIARSVNDDLCEAAVMLEREFMNRVGGGCRVPMACHAYLSGEGFRMMAVMGDINKQKMYRSEKSTPMDEIEELVEDISWNILEGCREREIPIPKDLPEHSLLKGTDGSKA